MASFHVFQHGNIVSWCSLQMDGSQVSRTNKQTQFSDTSLNSDITDIDGTALMSCLNSEELSKVSTDFRMDVCVASSDKTIPLSQRLLSAIIDVDEATCVQQVGDDAFQSHGFGSGLPSVDCNGSTYETRDPEGESACDGMRTNGSCFGATERAHWENPSSCGSQHRVYDKEKQLSSSELSDWGEQYRQMSLDDRLWTELRSIGLYPEQTVSLLVLLLNSIVSFCSYCLFRSIGTKYRWKITIEVVAMLVKLTVLFRWVAAA